MGDTKAWEVDTCRGHCKNVFMALFHHGMNSSFPRERSNNLSVGHHEMRIDLRLLLASDFVASRPGAKSTPFAPRLQAIQRTPRVFIASVEPSLPAMRNIFRVYSRLVLLFGPLFENRN